MTPGPDGALSARQGCGLGPEAQFGLKYILDCGTVSTAPAPPSSAVRRGHVTSRYDSDNLTSCGPGWDAARVDVPRGRVTSVREERHRSLAARRRRVPMPGWPGRRALGGRAGTKFSNANRTRGMRSKSCDVDCYSVLILREGSEIKIRKDVDRPAHLYSGPTFIPSRPLPSPGPTSNPSRPLPVRVVTISNGRFGPYAG